MKLVILILVALVATFLPSAAGAALQCGPGGAPDATRLSMCNCYSGYAPSTKATTDCNVNPLCPPIEKGDDSVGEYGANRPITSFAADRLNIYQTLPIVDRRLGATIRLVAPVGIPGVTPGAPGSSTCGYPGVLWNKTVSELTCTDEFRGSIPWTSHGLCGFVLDTTTSNNSTAIYKATLVTQYNETFTFNGKEQLRVHSNAYSVVVSFLRQKQISNLLVNVTMKSPVLTIDVIGDVLFDSFTGTTSLTLRTSSSWPYKIDSSSIAFESFISGLTGADVPEGVTANIAEDATSGLTCNSGASTVCRQQWFITINRGSADNCDIGGEYTFASTLLCRDGAPCGGAPSGSFAFNLLPTDFCFSGDVDATANSVYSLKAYQDQEHLFPAAQFGLATYVYFDLTVIDPAATLKGITFAEISLVSGNGRDIIYSTTAGVSPITGVHLATQEVNRIITPGTPANLAFSFQLLGNLLRNTLSILQPGGDLVSVSVEATINLVYYGDNKKREAKVAMELSQGAASTIIHVVPSIDVVDNLDLSSNSPVYTTSLFTILALLSFVLLF